MPFVFFETLVNLRNQKFSKNEIKNNLCTVLSYLETIYLWFF